MTYPDTLENRARRAKANAMIVLLLRFKIPVSDVEIMDDAQWQQLAIAANVKPPSMKTREWVLEKLREIMPTPKPTKPPADFHRRLMELEKRSRPKVPARKKKGS